MDGPKQSLEKLYKQNIQLKLRSYELDIRLRKERLHHLSLQQDAFD